jgi:hypothetical protein
VKREIQDSFTPDAHGALVSDSGQTIKNYDTKGKILDEVETSYWDVYHKMVAYNQRYYYSTAGTLDSTVTSVDDKFSMKLEYQYDSSGRESVIQEINVERKAGFRTVNRYNAFHQKSRVDTYDPQGKPYNFKNYTYDSRGNLIEESGTETGTPRYRWTYKYDRKNRLIERKDYSGNGGYLRKHRYEYNRENRLVKEIALTPKGNVERIVLYRYEYY